MTLLSTASTTAARSTPAFSTSATPSAKAVTDTTSARLIATLVRIACPFGPIYVTLGPIALRTGSTWSNAARSPPTMTDICPAASVAGLPETGQSRKTAPVARTRSASATLASGAIVLMSAQTTPSRNPASTPSGPSAVASIAAVFVSIVNSTSTYSSSSRGVSAHPMPASRSGCAFSLVRFQPTTVWPASSRRCAMPAPMAPSPAKPTRSISLNIATPQLAGGVLDRLDDPQVAGAAAEVACERLAELLVARVRVLAKKRLHRHEEARRTEAALERVSLVERALKRVELPVRGQPFHRPERPPVRLHCEHQARADGLSVELDGACAADALLAPDLRPRQPCLVPDEVGQERARLDVALVGAPVDLHPHPHAAASSIARRASSPQSARR